MGIPVRYTEQMSIVGTIEQKEAIEDFAHKHEISQAAAFRQALDSFFGLVDGEHPPTESGTLTPAFKSPRQ